MFPDISGTGDRVASTLFQDIAQLDKGISYTRLPYTTTQTAGVFRAVIACSHWVNSAGTLPMYTGTPIMSNSFSDVCNGCFLASGLVMSSSSTLHG